MDETGKYTESEKKEYASCEIKVRFLLLKLGEETEIDSEIIWATHRTIGEAYARVDAFSKAIEVRRILFYPLTAHFGVLLVWAIT